MRPAFEAYVDGSSREASLQDFLAHAPAGQPSGQFRLYGGYLFDDEHLDRAVTLTQQFPGDVSRGVFNILEMQLNCGSGGALEGVGVAVGRGMGPDQGTQGFTLRLNAEFYTAGYSNVGNNIGGWGGMRVRWAGMEKSTIRLLPIGLRPTWVRGSLLPRATPLRRINGKRSIAI